MGAILISHQSNIVVCFQIKAFLLLLSMFCVYNSICFYGAILSLTAGTVGAGSESSLKELSKAGTKNPGEISRRVGSVNTEGGHDASERH